MNRLLTLLLIVFILPVSDGAAQISALSADKNIPPVHVLLVVAHPDDEYEMVGTVYRIAKELSGTVDQLIPTDGEAGYHYASLAEPYYGINLTDESAGRKQLPHIRREEARHAAHILGIRHQWFLNGKDQHFTLRAEEVLERSWNREAVLQTIVRRLQVGSYDFVLVLLPTAETHGKHKAATILALQAVQQFPLEQRPVVLGAQASGSDSGSYQPLPNYSLTATSDSQPAFHFDRDIRFGYWQLSFLSDRGGLGHCRAQVPGFVSEQVQAGPL